MLDIVQVGLGPLGRQIVHYAAERPQFRVVAAVDPAAGIAGRDLGELCDLPANSIVVAATLDELPQTAPAVAVLATFSSLERVAGQIEELTAHRLDVVSTCEELSYPWAAHPETAARLDRLCRRQDVTCLGTGVNPGFLMDHLPAVLTGLCQHVERIVVRRVQDASARRVPFQQKIGAGLTPAEFEQKAADGTLRHVGLAESAHLLARAAGWRLDSVEEELRPIIAEREVTSGYRPIAAGAAAGVEQVARGFAGGREVVRLEFRAGVGEPAPRDEIEIEGLPHIVSVIEGGVNGDVATCAAILNAVPVVRAAAPGLMTMLDLPAPTVGRAAV